MQDVTMKKIADLLHTELEPIRADIVVIKEIVDGHTIALDGIAKQLKDMNSRVTVTEHILEKHESAIEQTAEKVGILPEVKSILNS